MPLTDAQRRAQEAYRKRSVKQVAVRFYPAESDLWEWLQTQRNKAGYIKALIRADMEGGLEGPTLRTAWSRFGVVWSGRDRPEPGGAILSPTNRRRFDMLMSDAKIKGLIRSGVLMDANESNVGPVSYDLTTKCFYADGKELDETTLNPGESVFVGSAETVNLPRDLAARIQLKNSRIRQGLSLDAPLYFPGHSTRLFFRVTNVSADAILLDTARGIAQVTFETVDGVEAPYEGAFSKEFDFKGLASYEDVYGDQVKKIERKKGEVEGIERRIYGNVLALFGIFAAIFTLVNVNAGAVSSNPIAFNVVIVDLMVVGGFTLLAAVIDSIISGSAESKPKRWLYVIAGIALGASVILAFCLN